MEYHQALGIGEGLAYLGLKYEKLKLKFLCHGLA
jgi:hypothetical protein